MHYLIEFPQNTPQSWPTLWMRTGGLTLDKFPHPFLCWLFSLDSRYYLRGLLKMQLSPTLRDQASIQCLPNPDMWGQVCALSMFGGDTDMQKGRTSRFRWESCLLLLWVTAPCLSTCLPAPHTFPSAAQGSSVIESGHTDSWFTQNWPDTPSGGVRSVFSLPSPPSWKPGSNSKGWELSSLAHLSHPTWFVLFPQLLQTCARGVEIMLTTKQSCCHLHVPLHTTKVLSAVLLSRAMIMVLRKTYLETQRGQNRSVYVDSPYTGVGVNPHRALGWKTTSSASEQLTNEGWALEVDKPALGVINASGMLRVSGAAKHSQE